MSNQIYRMVFAGHPLRLSFLYPNTRFALWPLPRRCEDEEADIAVTPEQIEVARGVFAPDSTDEFLEYRCILGEVAKALLRWRCCLFHAVAFLWQGKAWLIAAPSGTGKSTQFFNWKRLHPEELTILSGDIPALEMKDDGSFQVHPSSWNGKENIATWQNAPLGGLVFLRQGKENRLVTPPPEELIVPLLYQFAVIPETEEQIRSMAAMVEGLLRAVPCKLLVNLGDDASTELLREAWLKDLAEKEAEHADLSC